MWIRGVDLPRQLIESHRRGRLVVFVGAGASRAEPSGLPDFLTLAQHVASEAQVVFSERDYERPDVLLGELDDQHDVDVHLRVKSLLSRETSLPNRLHRAIGALAATSADLRIVTTNYDRHLSSALLEQGIAASEFEAPAVPLGDHFTGLVYLHGSLRQEHGSLVVTDADFGRAYLRDAWATRFLERMFTEYTVLFVGYSHNDIVMQYLARGLGRQTDRFALTDSVDSPLWRRLGIYPVGYPNEDGSHEALAVAVEEWAERSSMGMLDHRRLVSRLVSSPPSPVPDEVSYLEEIVAGDETAGFFAEFARGEEWLSWALMQPAFRDLFSPLALQPRGAGQALAHWFAEHYVLNEELTGRSLSAVKESGGHLTRVVWLAIAQRLNARYSGDSGDPRPQWLGSWLVLLIQEAPDWSGDLLEHALLASRWQQHAKEALLLLDHLTEPKLGWRDSLELGGVPSPEVRFRGDPLWLEEAWTGVFVPNLPEAAPDVLALVERQIGRAHALLAVASTTALAWSRFSSRSAIEPHPQDRSKEPVDVLIDAARDCIESMLDARIGSAPTYLERWGSSSFPILKRLALHGWIHRTDVDATAKLRWLIDRDWLYDVSLRHEVFRLIATALPDVDAEVADALVEAGLSGPPSFAESREYEIFNLLAWMVRSAPGLSSANEAFRHLQEEHPQYAVLDHPDMSRWSVTGSRATQWPMMEAQLHELIGNDCQAAIAELRRYEDVALLPWEGPDWSDALGLVVATVALWPRDGLAIFDADVDDQKDIIRAVIRGWSNASVDPDSAGLILDRLGRDDTAEFDDEIARLLVEGNVAESQAIGWHALLGARSLAVAIWLRLSRARRARA